MVLNILKYTNLSQLFKGGGGREDILFRLYLSMMSPETKPDFNNLRSKDMHVIKHMLPYIVAMFFI